MSNHNKCIKEIDCEEHHFERYILTYIQLLGLNMTVNYKCPYRLNVLHKFINENSVVFSILTFVRKHYEFESMIL